MHRKIFICRCALHAPLLSLGIKFYMLGGSKRIRSDSEEGASFLFNISEIFEFFIIIIGHIYFVIKNS